MSIVHISNEVISERPELMDLVFDKFGHPKDLTQPVDKLNRRCVLKFEIEGYKENEWVNIVFYEPGDGTILCDTMSNLGEKISEK